MDGFEIIAHRGSSFLAPENTLSAVRLAWAEGADAVEADFRLTRDGRIVAMHDETLKRTAGIDRPLAEFSLDELHRLDVGSWKDAKFGGEPVPTLEGMLATVPAGKRFFVEVKCGAEIIDPLCRVVEQSNLNRQQILPISLDLPVCQAIKNALPDCPVYWVVDFKRDDSGNWNPTWNEVFRKVESASEALIDGLDLMATGPIDAESVRRAKSAGLALCVWTVDDPALARRLIDLGIEGITTNRPGWLRTQLSG